MLKIFKRNKKAKQEVQAPIIPAEKGPSPDDSGSLTTPDELANFHQEEEKPLADRPKEPPERTKKGLFSRFKSGLTKTRAHLGEGLARIVLGKKTLDDDLFEEIETQLLMADVGIETTQSIMAHLTDKLKRKQLSDGQSVMDALKQQLLEVLQPADQALTLQVETKPLVILMVGINGAGKTTTIGKLAKRFQAQGKSVMLAAGDTFRAAAVEQLQVWGERNQIPVVAQHTGADSASVIFDALKSAQAKQIDVLLADTAGRLHTQDNLMEELKKVKRVIQKLDADAPHEIMLVLDAGIGQNALVQANEFHQAIGLTGITMTKLDGTAKGGILFAIAQQLALPFRYIGMGEGIDDLKPFDATQFVNAVFDRIDDDNL